MVPLVFLFQNGYAQGKRVGLGFVHQTQVCVTRDITQVHNLAWGLRLSSVTNDWQRQDVIV